MNKFGNCSQCRSLLLIPKMLLFSVENGATNAPPYWHWRNERSPLMETVQNMPSGSVSASTITLRRDEFHSRVGNSFLNCQQPLSLIKALRMNLIFRPNPSCWTVSLKRFVKTGWVRNPISIFYFNRLNSEDHNHRLQFLDQISMKNIIMSIVLLNVHLQIYELQYW